MNSQTTTYSPSGKRVNPGQLSTRITILNPADEVSSEGIQTRTYSEAGRAWCRWVNAHGTETLQAHSYGLSDTATLTLRYHPELSGDSVIVRQKDGVRFDVISVDNVRERGFWQEIKVKRRVEAL